MKKSDFMNRFAAGWDLRDSAAEDASVAARIAEDAGITWDPEEPEVLWRSGPYRITATGECQINPFGRPGWEIQSDPHPAMAVLAHRLLEERKQQEALDEHNDKLEAEEGGDPEVIRWLREDVARHRDRLNAQEDSIEGAHDRLQLHDQRLTKVEQDLLLVRGQAAHLDEREAADYLSTQGRLAALEEWRGAANDLPTGVDAQRKAPSRWVQVDREVYDGLLAVWRLWGTKGELRTKLTGVDFSGMQYGGGYLQQLRSELLALPDEVKP